MDQVIADKMNSAVRIETTVGGGGTPEYAEKEEVWNGTVHNINFDPNSVKYCDNIYRNISEYDVSTAPHTQLYQLEVDYTFNTTINTLEKMRLIAAVHLSINTSYDDPDYEGCQIFIQDVNTGQWVNTGLEVLQGFRWLNVTLDNPERYIDETTGYEGNLKIKIIDEQGGSSTQQKFHGNKKGHGPTRIYVVDSDPSQGTLRIDCMEVAAEPLVLKVSNLGGIDVRLSRLWITNSTETTNPEKDHLFADLENLNVWVSAGSQRIITLSDSTEYLPDGSLNCTIENNQIIVYYVPHAGVTVQLKVLTITGNTAACSYTFP